jgi:hypothetical protein
MFNSLLSKLAVVAATAIVGLGAVTAPAHALGKTLSGTLENGMTYSGSFEGEDKSDGGAIELDELTAFTMNIFSEGKTYISLGLNDLYGFAYSDKGALSGDRVGYYSFWDGFYLVGSNEKGHFADMAAFHAGNEESTFNYNNALFGTGGDIGNYNFVLTSITTSHIGDLKSVPEPASINSPILKSEISDLKSVPEPASMLGLLAVGAAGISTLKSKKKQQA